VTPTATKAASKPIDLSGIGDELDRLSLEALEAKYPVLAGEITHVIDRGASSEQVRRYAIRRRLPPEWVAWLESSARAVTFE